MRSSIAFKDLVDSSIAPHIKPHCHQYHDNDDDQEVSGGGIPAGGVEMEQPSAGYNQLKKIYYY